jgi:hypothetical protein
MFFASASKIDKSYVRNLRTCNLPFYYSWVSLGSFSAKYLLRKVLTAESSIGATIKAINPPTRKPGTNREANQKHRPFTTKENPPKVRILMGKDNKDTTGFTPALTRPILAPAIKAAGKLAMLTPGNMISTTKRLRAVAKTAKSEPNIIH